MSDMPRMEEIFEPINMEDLPDLVQTAIKETKERYEENDNPAPFLTFFCTKHKKNEIMNLPFDSDFSKDQVSEIIKEAISLDKFNAYCLAAEVWFKCWDKDKFTIEEVKEQVAKGLEVQEEKDEGWMFTYESESGTSFVCLCTMQKNSEGKHCGLDKILKMKDPEGAEGRFVNLFKKSKESAKFRFQSMSHFRK